MGWLVAGLLFVICILLVRKNYELEKRWRNLRYCWQTMSDFAGTRLRDDDAEYDCHDDWQWKEVAREHIALMGRFGVRPLTDFDIQLYERAMLDWKLMPLQAHK